MRSLDERGRQTISELLYLSNQAFDIRTYLKELTSRLAAWTGCEAVGIRLVDGDDFPYFETHGFPRQFVEMERFLCGRDSNGEVIRDADGQPFLECMCGNVVRGRVDPSKPFFTEILHVAQIPGFLGNLEVMYEEADVEGRGWREFTAAWWDAYGDFPKTVKELTDFCEERDLLPDVCGDGSSRPSRRSIRRPIRHRRPLPGHPPSNPLQIAGP